MQIQVGLSFVCVPRLSGVGRAAFDNLRIAARQAELTAVHLHIADADVRLSDHHVQREILAVDGQLPVSQIRTMEQVLSESTARQNFNMLLLSIFAGLALLLAAIGIYGLMSYTVEQRTQEIGIRLALGAGRGDMLKLVLRQGMLLAGIGVVIGLAAAFGLTRLLASLLFGVKATDPLTYAAVAVVLISVALFATYVPARRATRIDPLVALRYE